MKRTLVVVAAVVGFATAAGAATLTAFTTNAANVVQNTFLVGETILLKVTGDATVFTPDLAIQGGVTWNPAVAAQAGATTQGSWLPAQGALPNGAGFSYVFSQTSGAAQAPINAIDTSVVPLIATALGVSNVTMQVGSVLDFFGIYDSPPSSATVHSFTVIVPEPATAGLIGLGLLGLVLGGRRRA